MDGPEEASVDGGADAAPDCGALPPTGKQIVKSTDPLVILALTEDSHAIYEDLTSQLLYAVPVAGGAPSKIGMMTSQGRTIWTRGPAVLYLPSAADPTTSIAPLSSWSAAGGTHVISPSILAVDSYYYTYDVSEDGSSVAYFAATPTSSTATLTISSADGKTQTPLVPNIDLTNMACFPPAVQFVKNTLVAQYCLAPAPATEVSTIATFAAPSFTQATIGTSFTPTPGPVPVDPAGKNLLLPGPTDSGLYLYPIGGGAPVVVDPQGNYAAFTPSGDIVYTTINTALMRYDVATATATMLVPTGLNYPLAVSPDGNWLQIAQFQDSTTELTDLYVASTTTPGTAKQIVSTATSSALGFTADSTYGTFGTGFPATFGSATFDFQAAKTTGGAAFKVLSAANAPLYTSGAKLISNTNQSKTTGAADIVSVDLATNTPVTLVTQADPGLFLATSSELVYSWYCDENATAGIWTTTVP